MYHMEYYKATESNAEAEKAVACFGDVQKNLTALVGMKFNDPIIDSIVATMQNFQPAVELSEKYRAELAVHHKSLEKTQKAALKEACQIRQALLDQINGSNCKTFANRILLCSEFLMVEDKNQLYKDDSEKLAYYTKIAADQIVQISRFAPEIGQSAVLNRMLGYLKSYTATEMSQTSQLMSDGANRQAASAEEVSSSVEQMAASVSQNSDNARATEKIAQNALLSIRKGTEASTQSMAAMKEIAEKNLNC